MVPSLAAELPETSDGGRIFRFRLRDGIKFHNGREITAEDISWSLHRLLSERIGSPGYPFFKSIEGAPAYHTGEADRVEGIVVLDDKTIEFRLDEADQTFLNALAMPFAYPLAKEHVEKLEEAEGRTRWDVTRSDQGPSRFHAGSAAFKSSSNASKNTGRRGRAPTG